MEEQDRSPMTEKGMTFLQRESSLRLQVTDMLLGRLRDASMGRSTREHSDILQRIEAELETYGSYFYPPEHR